VGRTPKKKKELKRFAVVSYIDGNRRVHKVDATSYRNAKRLVARQLREDLEMFDTNLEDITGAGLLTAHRLPEDLF